MLTVCPSPGFTNAPFCFSSWFLEAVEVTGGQEECLTHMKDQAGCLTRNRKDQEGQGEFKHVLYIDMPMLLVDIFLHYIIIFYGKRYCKLFYEILVK